MFICKWKKGITQTSTWRDAQINSSHSESIQTQSLTSQRSKIHWFKNHNTTITQGKTIKFQLKVITTLSNYIISQWYWFYRIPFDQFNDAKTQY